MIVFRKRGKRELSPAAIKKNATKVMLEETYQLSTESKNKGEKK